MAFLKKIQLIYLVTLLWTKKFVYLKLPFSLFSPFLLQLDLIVEVSNTETSFGVRKGLPYTEFLNIEVGKLTENGMIKNYWKRDDYHLPCQGQDNSNGVVPIIIEKVVLAFSILLIGIIFSQFCMILEMLSNFSAFASLNSFFWSLEC